MNAVVQEAAPAAPFIVPLELPALNSYVPGKGIFRGLVSDLTGHFKLFEAKARIDPGTWADVKAAAEALREEGQEDWKLPTRVDSALLYAVAKDEHERDWYWTSEPYGSGDAWYQDFRSGTQRWGHQSSGLIRGCAVRREPLQ